MDSSARVYDKPGRLQQVINKYSDLLQELWGASSHKVPSVVPKWIVPSAEVGYQGLWQSRGERLLELFLEESPTLLKPGSVKVVGRLLLT